MRAELAQRFQSTPWIDNQRMGGLSALDQITVAQIREIRYLTASDATTLFGTGNTGGAIQVIGRR